MTGDGNFKNLLILVIKGYEKKQEKCITDFNISIRSAYKTSCQCDRTSGIVVPYIFSLLFYSGNDFMKTEKFSDAIECYSQALKLDNKNSVYYCNRYRFA